MINVLLQLLHSREMLVIGHVILTKGSHPQNWRVLNNVAAIRHHVMLIPVREAQMGVPLPHLSTWKERTIPSSSHCALSSCRESRCSS